MSERMLQNYNNWVDKSAEEILNHVKTVGGWANVFTPHAFPSGLPIWAHRVRNYFNREPTFLMRLDKNQGEILVKRLQYTATVKNEGSIELFKRLHALSDDVYVDETKEKYWFQMSPAGAIYHLKEIANETLEGIYQAALGQSWTPIFKLVSPDGSGGSHETIIYNILRVGEKWGVTTLVGGSNIGDANVPMPVAHRIYKTGHYKGSYNYAETIVKGNPAHDKLDVKPHKDIRYKTYENPPDCFAPLKSRRFPKYAKGETIPLAEQI